MHLLTCQPCGLHSDNLSSDTGRGTGARAVITYYGHSAHGIPETDRLLRQLRGELASDTWTTIRLTAARPLAVPFGAEISRDFGIEAQCLFNFSLIDTDRAHLYRPALIETAYRIFGTDHLVITWEFDHIVPASGAAAT